MEREERNKKSSVYTGFRGSLHIGMGGIYLAIGISVIYFKSFGVMELNDLTAYVIGAVLLLYGAFRVWRGWTDLKQRRR